MTDIITTASQSITAQNTYATISYVPQKARVAIGLSGISDSTVTLEAQWNQTGNFIVQKTWTSDPADAEHFDAPRACTLRLGVATGNYGTDTIQADCSYWKSHAQSFVMFAELERRMASSSSGSRSLEK